MALDRYSLVRDLCLPTLLFAALGAMSWAVRGCVGFGGSSGCIFAGVLWGTAWWFLAQSGGQATSRRYTSGWIVLAMTVGIGMSGARGWMQWHSFFDGKLQTNYAAGEFLPISRVYGFVWLFIAGVPWAGVGACLLAWCGSLRETRGWHWAIRIACGIGGALLARSLFFTFPQFFLPLYESLVDRYQDIEHNPNLGRLINDSRSAILHMGLYLGLLAYEVARRDWKNVVLITTVGVVSGAGWSLFQTWKWASHVWPDTSFNWWRCWESSGGISIGIAYGLAWFLVNRGMSDEEQALFKARRSIAGPNLEWLFVFLLVIVPFGVLMVEEVNQWGFLMLAVLGVFAVLYYLLRGPLDAEELLPTNQVHGDPNLERFGLYLGLILGLGFSLRNGLKGWFFIHYGRDEYYGEVLWQILGPGILLCLAALCVWTVVRPLPRDFRGNIFPHAYGLIWLVLIFQNVLAQLVTGPLSEWSEFVFSIYYLLLFAITALIVMLYSGRVERDIAGLETGRQGVAWPE
ncbi:MAG: hypothetical protein L0Z07_05305 [Planctomycetes bacterium]|nr:hypothetical protein [Planctomycetota bacterium]